MTEGQRANAADVAQPALTALSLDLGRLLDTHLHQKIAHARENGVDLKMGMIKAHTDGSHTIKGVPLDEWINTRIQLRPQVLALLEQARSAGVNLTPDNIKINGGELTIDGMPAAEWVDAMTMD